MRILPVLLCDGYKIGHKFQYTKDTTLIYSNFTPRKCRDNKDNGVIAFGAQYFVLEYLVHQFDTNFFSQPLDYVIGAYRRRITNYLGPTPDNHIAALHKLQYLPLLIKAIPEGTLVPFRMPILTIRNTVPEFFWLTNMLETLLSNVLWLGSTSATTAFGYRKMFERYAQETGAPKDFVKWQGHDFSFRGMTGIEAACISGAAHLLSFTGTDTIPAIDFLEQYYGADCEKELIGGSVPATEHSVMSMGMADGEFETFKRLLTEVYPAGILSIVSDTWDFWKVLTDYLSRLKDIVLARNGKLVIRPDSGDPYKIICGDGDLIGGTTADGAIQTLWNVFGGTVNAAGYKELDPHVGLIYGDSITRDLQERVLAGLKAKGFASSNVVLGIGSYTYQHVTRDTHGWAMKATYGETLSGGGQAIFKKPATDDGTKDSAKGLLCVRKDPYGRLMLSQEVDWNTEATGLLRPIFKDRQVMNMERLSDIRARVESQL